MKTACPMIIAHYFIQNDSFRSQVRRIHRSYTNTVSNKCVAQGVYSFRQYMVYGVTRAISDAVAELLVNIRGGTVLKAKFCGKNRTDTSFDVGRLIETHTVYFKNGIILNFGMKAFTGNKITVVAVLFFGFKHEHRLSSHQFSK